MQKYLYTVKVLLKIFKSILDSDIDKNNYIENINEIIGIQGLSLLLINSIGTDQFKKFYEEYREKTNKKTFKFEMIELLYKRLLLSGT